MTFKLKLALYSMLISTIPVLIVGWWATTITSKSIQEEVETNHRLLLKQIEYRMDQLFNSLNTQAVLLSLNPTVVKSVEMGPTVNSNVVDSMTLVEMLKNQSNLSHIRFNISLAYRKYNHVYSTVQKSIPFKDSTFDKILENTPINRNAPIIIPPNRFNNEDLMLLRPIPYSSHYTEGIIALNVDHQELSSLLTNSDTDPNYQSLIWIVDASGRIIVSNSGERVGSQLMSSSELYRFWKNPNKGSNVHTWAEEKHKLIALHMPRYDFTILTMTPMKELNKKSDRIQYITWGMILLLISLWIVISFAGTHHIHAPIGRLLKRVPIQYGKDKESVKGLLALEGFLNDTMYDNQKLQRNFTDHLPYLQENMSRHLLWGDMTEEEIHNKATQLNLNLTGAQYRVLLIIVDNLSLFMDKYAGKDQSLMQYAIRKMVEEICGIHHTCIAFTPQPGQVAVIISEQADNIAHMSNAKLLRTSMEIHQAVVTYCKFTVSICISSSQSGATGIRECYSEALELSNFRMLLGPNTTITEQMLEPSFKQYSRDIISIQKNMIASLIKGQRESANECLIHLTEQIGSTVDHPETARGIFSHLLVELDSCLYELGHHLQELFQENLHTRLYQCGTVVEIRDWLSDEVFTRVEASLNSFQVSNQEKAVMAVLQSINENWDADFMEIADQYNISVPNLSRTFKEKTGEKFSDYMIRIRMNKAKEWLEHSQMSIVEISGKLHYSNVQNFSRTFKQYTGTTPGKYRSQKEES